ncbi:hypothetical protein [Lacipirellula limnantheis]|uniref:Uncharacterized protein n=1 Tax=Lacipirellula limnantheis TaxID=2528024 RepID=A0A517U1N5_9BACT|nr:hypothetical protein [Lacipirellula limnantheis]QDT74523.1 hypothetical protein I41_37200 [Lacipirellula limnantheis]
MAKFIRYALASVCFAASVACLALWWRSMSKFEVHNLRLPVGTTRVWNINTYCGTVSIALLPEDLSRDAGLNAGENWAYYDFGQLEIHDGLLSLRHRHGMFGPVSHEGVYFPVWYPALIFALAGVGALRFGRRFTLRSAILATTVVAGLLGMAVGL